MKKYERKKYYEFKQIRRNKMNINDLIFDIEVEFKSLINKYESGISYSSKTLNPQMQKEIMAIRFAERDFKLLAGKITDEDLNNYYDADKIKKDLEVYLKLFKIEYADNKQRATSICSATNKLLDKYKYIIAKMRQSYRSERMMENLLYADQKKYTDKTTPSLSNQLPKISRQNVAENKTLNNIKIKENKPKIDKYNIKYNAQEDSYYINGNLIDGNMIFLNPSQKMLYIKVKLRDESVLGYLFNKFDASQMKALKKCDPNVVVALANIDLFLAKEYLDDLVQKDNTNKSWKKYQITYDIRGIDKMPREKLSFWNKINTKLLVKNNAKVSKVLKDKAKAPWYAIFPMIGAIAVSGIVGLIGSKNVAKLDAGKSYTDTTNPDNEKNTVKETDKESEVQDTVLQSVTDYTEATHTQDANMNNNTSNNVGTIDEIEDAGIDVREDDIQDVSVKIGDKINVADGQKYTADCLGGGNSNKIGAVSWRPSSEYYIDGVAFLHGGKILKVERAENSDVKQDIRKLAEKFNIGEDEIDTSVLLSLVKGRADTGWAQIGIEDVEHSLVEHDESVQSVEEHENDVDFDR